MGKFNENSDIQILELKNKILKEPDNIEIKNECEDIELDKQQANYDFKSLVEVMLDMLEREQIETLLRFSKVLV